MKRRNFIKVTGSLTALLIGGLVFRVENHISTQAKPSENDVFSAIDESIKVNFGSGFQLKSYKKEAGKVISEIEHLENHYLVVSTDLHEWSIISSSIT